MKKQHKAPQRSRKNMRPPTLTTNGVVDNGGAGSGNFGHGGRPGERGGSAGEGSGGGGDSKSYSDLKDIAERRAEKADGPASYALAAISHERAAKAAAAAGKTKEQAYHEKEAKDLEKWADRAQKKMTTNEEDALEAHLESFTCNVRAKLVRNDTMEGKTYKVVPMVMMVVGVHSGSQGALYYPKSELSKMPESWNHKPVVVYHPTMNGKGVSACSPDVLTSHKIGLIMNTKFDSLGRLVAEAWLDPDRIEKVDPRVSKAIDKLSTLECSTGMFMEVENVEGKFEGEEYKGIARNFRPDHLAVLPDKTGACSVKDGAGFIRNEETEETKQKPAVEQSKEPTFNCLGTNEQSFENIRSNLDKALQERFAPRIKSDINSNNPYLYSCYTIAVYTDFVVYSDKGKLFKLSYTSTDTKVELSEDDPVEVVRVTEFRTVDGAFVGNTSTQSNSQRIQRSTMNKNQIVDGLIANGGWEESDREFLMGLNAAQMDKMAKGKKAAAEEEDEEEMDPKAKKGKSAPTCNSVEEFIGQAPAEMQDVLRSGLAAHQSTKNGLIDSIVANAANKFTKEQLNAMPLGQLEAVAALAKAQPAAAPVSNTQGKPADYSGQGGQATPTTNNKQEVLTTPVVNWAKK